MKRTPMCKYCKEEAIWAMQFIADRKPSFYALGWHERGFPVVKVCDSHFNIINDAWQTLGQANTGLQTDGGDAFEKFLINLGEGLKGFVGF